MSSKHTMRSIQGITHDQVWDALRYARWLMKQGHKKVTIEVYEKDIKEIQGGGVVSYILTKRGNHFDFIDMSKNVFDVEEVARALSNMCRFNGHCREFYSVAQHSIYVASLVKPELRKAALLHDAAEAFIGDMTTPLKQLIPAYKAIERQVERWIIHITRCDIHHPDIKAADLAVLAAEKRDLMPHDPQPWPVLDGIEPAPIAIEPLKPDAAFLFFMREFYKIEES